MATMREIFGYSKIMTKNKRSKELLLKPKFKFRSKKSRIINTKRYLRKIENTKDFKVQLKKMKDLYVK